MAIRQHLTEQLAGEQKLGKGLANALRVMRAACRKFIDAGGPDGRFFEAHGHPWPSDRFCSPSASYAPRWGHQIAALASTLVEVGGTRMFVEGEFLDTVIGIPDSRTEIVGVAELRGGQPPRHPGRAAAAHVVSSPQLGHTSTAPPDTHCPRPDSLGQRSGLAVQHRPGSSSTRRPPATGSPRWWDTGRSSQRAYLRSTRGCDRARDRRDRHASYTLAAHLS